MTQIERSMQTFTKPPLCLANSKVLEQEVQWFSKVLDTRLSLYFETDTEYNSIYELLAPSYQKDESAYATLIQQYDMSVDERLVLMLGLLPHIKPHILNRFFIQDKNINKDFVEFGGVTGKLHRGFLPTLETAAFIIAGDDIYKRLMVLTLLDNEHFFIKDGIFEIRILEQNESLLTSPLTIAEQYLYKITIGKIAKPDFSATFPAKRINTKLEWQDLVLPKKVQDEIEHILAWLQHKQIIMFEMGLDKIIKPGYRALFYGPPGTGKTLTASLLGKTTGMDVYRIELSSVVSKYIGETEKNLEKIFKQAENKNWILFFDEADSLFSKRTGTSSSNDRFANQEVSYLLQRIENFPGVVILATNLKENIDDAFSRRFQSITFFPIPNASQRLRLWQKAFENSNYIDESLDLSLFSRKYELTGGDIINVIRFAAVHSLKNQRDKISKEDLLEGISKELRKDGRLI